MIYHCIECGSSLSWFQDNLSLINYFKVHTAYFSETFFMGLTLFIKTEQNLPKKPF